MCVIRCWQRLCLLSLAAGIGFPLVGQPLQAGVALSRNPLWKIQGPHNVVYILGSIHILKREDYPLTQQVKDAFADCPITMFETDLDKGATQKMQQRLADQALLPPGQSLRDVLSPDTYARFQEQVKAMGLREDMFERTKPFIASLTLQVLTLKKLGLDPEWGIDRFLQDHARSQGKRVLTLEPVTFQFDLITRFSPKEAEQLMAITLEDIHDLPAIFARLRTAWRTGDLPELERLVNHSMRGVPALYKRMVTERNRRWLPRVVELLDYPGNCIVIVGAGHLVGPEGLLALLERHGLHPIQQ